MVFQQAIGINGIIYYAGQIFVSAGEFTLPMNIKLFSFSLPPFNYCYA